MKKDNNVVMAKEVFDKVRAYLDDNDLHYSVDESDNERLCIQLSMRSADLVISILMRVDAERQLLRVFSPLPFNFSKEKMVEGAVAIAMANNVIVDGCFDLDVLDGEICFRICGSWRDGIGAEVIEYLLWGACITVDKFNDKMLNLSQGNITLDEYRNETGVC